MKFDAVTRNSSGLLKKPMLFEIILSLFQGQPYFVILLVMVEVISPLISKSAVLQVPRLVLLILWLALSLVLVFFMGRLVYRTEHGAAYIVGSEGRLALGEYLRKLSMGFFKGRDPGDITALMLKDYSNVEILISHLLMGAVGAVVLPLLFAVFLIPVNWQMTLVTLMPLPLALLAAAGARTLVNRLGKKQIRAMNEASSRMLEYLDGMRNIKSYNLHGNRFARLEKSFHNLKIMSIKLEGFAGPCVISGAWILYSGIALIMIFGVSFIIGGSLSVKHFLFFLIVGTRMYDPLIKVMINVVEMSYYLVSARRISDLYENKPLPEPEKSLPVLNHDIAFHDVTFRYHDTDVLSNVSCTLSENTMTALVGPSGSGKSTITRLIARFWDVNSGSITVGGVPIGLMRSEDLMSMISMVFQDVYLFNDTVMNNIKVGHKDASPADVRKAARRARCHDFIMNLPDGYETVVGEGGATLSGGEKQRISIARALLKDAPIVLLDEATASLDPENELYIQEAIGELVQGRTLIVIAHRLSTITHADQILVLDKGTILERGTHRELITREEGFYKNMWEEQKRAHLWKLAPEKEADPVG